MVGLTRFELVTSRLSAGRSDQLSYRPNAGKNNTSILLVGQHFFCFVLKFLEIGYESRTESRRLSAQRLINGVLFGVFVSLKRMDIQTVVVGGGPISSVIVLRLHDPRGVSTLSLPIKIGNIEASAISLGIDQESTQRPLTHDLLRSVLDSLDADIKSVRIVGVHGTTFFSQIELISKEGEHIYVDARPSDAIALAVRTNAPIFADESVLEIAAAPDFTDVEKDVQAQELEEFHQFIEDISPEDFS